MIKRTICVIFFISLIFKINAQINLVPNYSFEDTTQCPFLPGQIYFAAPWTDPNNGSSDLFYSCASSTYVGVPTNIEGTQSARTGNAYAGIMTYAQGTNLREYIQIQLDSQLEISKTYYVEFFVSMSDTQTVAANNIGAYFSNIPITASSGQLLSYAPQINNNPVINPLTDKIGWTKVLGNFIANGTENYITIGNFLNDISTDTIFIGGGCTGCDAAYYYMDDISVTCIDCDTGIGINELENVSKFKLFPNPNDGSINFIYSLNETSSGELIIYDLAGKLIIRYVLLVGKNNQAFINETQLKNGIYFYKVIINKELKKSDKIVIIK
jgi:hypothetical protein